MTLLKLSRCSVVAARRSDTVDAGTTKIPSGSAWVDPARTSAPSVTAAHASGTVAASSTPSMPASDPSHVGAVHSLSRHFLAT